MKKLLIILTSASLLVAASCAAPELTATSPATTPAPESATTSPATTPIPEPTTTVPPTTTPPETTLPPSISSLPPGYVTYSNQDWLLVDWTLSGLSTKPKTPEAGQSVEVWADIYISSGDVPFSFILAELTVNGELMDSDTLIFWYDDSLPFSLSFTPEKPGVYEIVVRVNMLENEIYAQSSGEDLSLYSIMTLTVPS